MYYTSAKISISLLIFKRIKGGRDETVSTLQRVEFDRPGERSPE